MYLKPSSTHTISLHPSILRGQKPQSLSVNKHDFPGKNNNRKVAFLFRHAVGYHKEILHPIMKGFRDQLRSRREYDRTDITFISWDDRRHGDSARLNEGCLSEHHRMTDSALDTKQVIDFFDLKKRYDHFIGVGHNLGACSLLLCEYYYPGTFNGLFLVEPIVEGSLESAISISKMVAKAFQNRADEWEEVEEFRKSLLSKDVYKVFHPELFELYAKYGLYETYEHMFKLKCERRSEGIVFRDSANDSYICSKAIRELTIPTQFLLATKSVFTVSKSESEFWKATSKLNTIKF